VGLLAHGRPRAGSNAAQRGLAVLEPGAGQVVPVLVEVEGEMTSSPYARADSAFCSAWKLVVPSGWSTTPRRR
jgi:hypothetical protein